MTKPLLHLLPIACLFVIAALAVVATPAFAMQPFATSNSKPFSGNLCGLPIAAELSVTEISEPCVEEKTRNQPVKRTPFGGSLGEVHYGAGWGQLLGATPIHHLKILFTKVQGSGKGLKLFEKNFRSEVLSNGLPVHVGNPGSLITETYSCTNPPTDDCTSGQLFAIVGQYDVRIFLYDYPPTNPSATEEPPGADEAEDEAQEKPIKAPLIAIGQEVAARL